MSGRKRKLTPRQPNGQPARLRDASPQDYSPTAVRRLTDAAIAGMQDAVWASTLGHAFLRGHITAQQFEAGKRWSEARREYVWAIGASNGPKVATMGEATKAAPPDPDSEAGQFQAKREQRIIRKFESMMDALFLCGWEVGVATRNLCEEEHIISVAFADLQRAKIGLQALHEHITNGLRKRVDN